MVYNLPLQPSCYIMSWSTMLYWDQGPFHKQIFICNSNSMEISPCCNPITDHQIATNFCTYHDSTAVMSCAKFCGDHLVRIVLRAKQHFRRIWIVMEKTSVKWAPWFNRGWLDWLTLSHELGTRASNIHMKISSSSLDMTTRPWMPFSRSSNWLRISLRSTLYRCICGWKWRWLYFPSSESFPSKLSFSSCAY